MCRATSSKLISAVTMYIANKSKHGSIMLLNMISKDNVGVGGRESRVELTWQQVGK